jgi:hypothetical protein
LIGKVFLSLIISLINSSADKEPPFAKYSVYSSERSTVFPAPAFRYLSFASPIALSLAADCAAFMSYALIPEAKDALSAVPPAAVYFS